MLEQDSRRNRAVRMRTHVRCLKCESEIARRAPRGPFHLTMDTNDTIETARASPDAVIVPLHTDGWAHFRQNANDLRVSFEALGFGSRIKLLEPGVATRIVIPG